MPFPKINSCGICSVPSHLRPAVNEVIRSLLGSSDDCLRKMAVRSHQAGNYLHAAAALSLVIDRTSVSHVRHPDLVTFYNNRSAAWLALGAPQQAWMDALAALHLVESSHSGVPVRSRPCFARTMLRIGQACAALGRWQAALGALEEGLVADSSSVQLRLAHQQAVQALWGVDHAPEPHQVQAEADHVGPAPEVKDSTLAIRTEAQQSLLAVVKAAHPHIPVVKQLDTARAQVDVTTRDTLNYLTIQGDLSVPRQVLEGLLQDEVRLTSLKSAITQGVEDVIAQGLECRVLVMGSTMGVAPLMALQAGAVHVTVVERWLYMAAACRELLAHHGVDQRSYCIAHMPPTHAQLGRDVPVPANLLVLEGLLDNCPDLVSSLLLAAQHAVSNLMVQGRQGVRVIPEKIHIWGQASQGVTSGCTPTAPGGAVDPPSSSSASSLQVAGLDQWRSSLLPSGRPPLHPSAWLPLSRPALLWSVDLGQVLVAGEELEQGSSVQGQAQGLEHGWATLHRKVMLPPIERAGILNCVVCWCDIQVSPGTTFTSYQPPLHPLHHHHQQRAPLRASSMGPSLHYLDAAVQLAAGQYPVHLQLAAAISAGGIVFAYARPTPPLPPAPGHPGSAGTPPLLLLAPLYRPLLDPSLPPAVSALASDRPLLEGCAAALSRAVAQRSAAGLPTHCLVPASGGGILGVLAAQAGCQAVVATEEHPALATAATRHVALNGAAEQVVVVAAGDVKSQVAPHGAGLPLPPGGAGLLLVAGLLSADVVGRGVLPLLSALSRKGVISPDAAVVPAAATLYCLPLEVLSKKAPYEGGGSGLEDGHTHDTHHIDLSPLNKYRQESQQHLVALLLGCWLRWSKASSPAHLDRLPHKVLSHPIPLWHLDFAALATGRSGAATLGASHAMSLDGQPVRTRQLPDGSIQASAPALAEGVFNAVVLWFDLHLDDQVTLTTAPPGYGVGGSVASCSFQGQPPATNLPHATAADTQPHCNSGHGGAGEEGPAQGAPLLHWGQSVQYLDHVLVVHPGEALQVVASWAGGSPPCVRVDLRPGKGVKAPRPPWEEEWGGGVSIENPHVQRPSYCRLLDQDLMQRLPGGRGPSVTADVMALASHTGSLFLDPTSVCATLSRLSLMERLYRPPGVPDQDPCASWREPPAQEAEVVQNEGGCSPGMQAHSGQCHLLSGPIHRTCPTVDYTWLLGDAPVDYYG